jgi:hypothetical protein
MEDDQKKEEKGDDHSCRQIENAGHSNKKLGEEKIGQQTKHQDRYPCKKSEDSIFLPKPFLPDQSEGDQE